MSERGAPDALTPTVAAFLARARVAHLATADADGQPHVVPIVFVVCDGRLYTPLDGKPKRVPGRRLKRVRNLLANSRVAVVVDRYAEDWARLGYVLWQGRARLLDDADETGSARAALRRKYPQYNDEALGLDNATLIVVEPERVIVWGDVS